MRGLHDTRDLRGGVLAALIIFIIVRLVKFNNELFEGQFVKQASEKNYMKTSRMDWQYYYIFLILKFKVKNGTPTYFINKPGYA